MPRALEIALLSLQQLQTARPNALLAVGVAGPNGAGKSTFARELVRQLGGAAVVVRSRDYFLPDGAASYSAYDVASFDLRRLSADVARLKAGERVALPSYDWRGTTGHGGGGGGGEVRAATPQVLIVEGVFALADAVRPLLDLEVFLLGGVHTDLMRCVQEDLQLDASTPSVVFPGVPAFVQRYGSTAHLLSENEIDEGTAAAAAVYQVKGKVADAAAFSLERCAAALGADRPTLAITDEEFKEFFLEPPRRAAAAAPGDVGRPCSLLGRRGLLHCRMSGAKCFILYRDEQLCKGECFSCVCTPRLDFEVGMATLSGLLKLGYTRVRSFARESTGFVRADDGLTVKCDWIPELSESYLSFISPSREVAEAAALQVFGAGFQGYETRSCIELCAARGVGTRESSSSADGGGGVSGSGSGSEPAAAPAAVQGLFALIFSGRAQPEEAAPTESRLTGLPSSGGGSGRGAIGRAAGATRAEGAPKPAQVEPPTQLLLGAGLSPDAALAAAAGVVLGIGIGIGIGWAFARRR